MKRRQAFAHGILPGVLLFLALFLAGTHSLLKLAGDPDPDTARILQSFAPTIYLTYARIGLVHLWIGAVLGAMSGIVVWFLYPSLRVHLLWFRVASFLLLSTVFLYLSARLLIRQPTFFERFLEAQGAIYHRWQVFLTSHVSLVACDVAAALVALTLLLASRSFRSLVPRHLPWTRGQIVFTLAWAAIGLAVLLRYVWSPPHPELPERPNILLLSVDSLRPDHLSFEGYHRPTTPNIDRLARESRVFRHAYVPVARTLPSWSSLLTSTSPQTHGIRHMFPDSGRRRLPLPTLPEILNENGYRTGVVSDFAGEMFDLIDYQFDLVDTPPASDVDVLVERQMLLHFPLVFPFVNHRLGKRALPVISYLTINSDARALANRALRRMRELADDGPFFLTVFFSTSHAPYASPHPFYDRFTDPAYEGPHKYAYGIRDPRELMEGNPEYSAADREQITALYDGAVASVDDAIGGILEELRHWDFLDTTLIIVTADHGEHLFEGGNDLDHGKWFRGGDRANHIPLIVFDPAGELGRGPEEAQVRSVDLMPTLLARLGIEPPATCEGENLFPALQAGTPLQDLPVYAETGVWLKAPTTFRDEPQALTYPPINEILDVDRFDSTLILEVPFDEMVVEAKHRMLRTPPWKLVQEPTRGGLNYHLFDVVQDPGNHRDRDAEDPERAAAMRVQLEQWLRQDPCRRMDARGHQILSFTDLE